jgi:GTPase SAR1 family protein
MVGLDAAGKTTILYKLKLGEGTISQTCGVFMGTVFDICWPSLHEVDPHAL